MKIADHSRIWIFQSKRPFTAEEKEVIEHKLKLFIGDWDAHGAGLLAGYELPYDQFIVVGVDENKTMASGCSIDKLTKLVRGIDEAYELDLLNRMLVAYAKDEVIEVEKLAAFKELVKTGVLGQDTTVFNNGVATMADFRANWQQPLAESWAKGLMP